MNLRKLIGNLTLANQLTFLRLVAIPFFMMAVLYGQFGAALVLFTGAAVTDLLDGMTARLFGQRTRLGAFLDPAADKLLMTVAFVLLTEYPSMFQEIEMAYRLPLVLTILAISRDVFIVAVALMLYLAYGFQQFVPTVWGKLTTLFEMVTLWLCLWCNWRGQVHPTLPFMVWVTLGLILVSGLHYLVRTLRMLRVEGTVPTPDGP